MTAPMITTPGDYRTADGQCATIDSFGKRGKRARDERGEWWSVKTGKHSGHPALNIIGPWVAPEPLECWLNDYGDAEGPFAHKTSEDAEGCAGNEATRVAVHMVEASELARVQAERDEAVAVLQKFKNGELLRYDDVRTFLAKIGGAQ